MMTMHPRASTKPAMRSARAYSRPRASKGGGYGRGDSGGHRVRSRDARECKPCVSFSCELEAHDVVESRGRAGATEKYFNGYFGIDAAESAASGLSPYQPVGGGFRDVSFRLGMAYQATDKITVVGSFGVTHSARQGRGWAPRGEGVAADWPCGVHFTLSGASSLSVGALAPLSAGARDELHSVRAS